MSAGGTHKPSYDGILCRGEMLGFRTLALLLTRYNKKLSKFISAEITLQLIVHVPDDSQFASNSWFGKNIPKYIVRLGSCVV